MRENVTGEEVSDKQVEEQRAFLREIADGENAGLVYFLVYLTKNLATIWANQTSTFSGAFGLQDMEVYFHFDKNLDNIGSDLAERMRRDPPKRHTKPIEC